MQKWEYKVTLLQCGEFDFKKWEGQSAIKEAKLNYGWNEETSSWNRADGEQNWLEAVTRERLAGHLQIAEDMNAEGQLGW